jgi:hypothetical protein
MSQAGLGAPLRSRARPSLAPSSPAQRRASPRVAGPRTRVTFTGPEIFSQEDRKIGRREKAREGENLGVRAVAGEWGRLGFRGVSIHQDGFGDFTGRSGGRESCEGENWGGALSPVTGGVLGLGLLVGVVAFPRGTRWGGARPRFSGSSSVAPGSDCERARRCAGGSANPETLPIFRSSCKKISGTRAEDDGAGGERERARRCAGGSANPKSLAELPISRAPRASRSLQRGAGGCEGVEGWGRANAW